MKSSTIAMKTGEAYGLYNSQRSCTEVGCRHPLYYVSSCGWLHPRCCEKRKPLAYSHSRRKACGFAQAKEKAMKVSVLCKIKSWQVSI